MKKTILIGMCMFVLLFSFVSAISLDNTTVLNTTNSNSSMTFSVNISVDKIEIHANNITLSNISCGNGADPVANLFWISINENLDSGQYCVVSSPASGGPSPSQSTTTSSTNSDTTSINLDNSTLAINESCPVGKKKVVVGDEIHCVECNGQIKIVGDKITCVEETSIITVPQTEVAEWANTNVPGGSRTVVVIIFIAIALIIYGSQNTKKKIIQRYKK